MNQQTLLIPSTKIGAGAQNELAYAHTGVSSRPRADMGGMENREGFEPSTYGVRARRSDLTELPVRVNGEPSGDRTQDTEIKSLLLYR